MAALDLALVLDETYEARAKWHNLGVALKMSKQELESIESRCSSTEDGLREMLRTWLRRVEPQPTWAALVKALASKLVEEGPLAKGLEEKYCRDTAPVAPSRSQQQEEDNCDHKFSIFIKLKQMLESHCDLQDDSSREKVSQLCVEDYITKSLQSNASIELITEQLQQLCSGGLISENLYKQALVHHKSHSVLPPTPNTAEASSDSATVKSVAVEPLFNKDTVYHAGICCLAVCTTDARNYQQFFKDKTMVPGHSFTEVSLSGSESEQDRFLIAQQGKSTIYLSFQCEPLLLEWSKRFKNSFSEGIDEQCRNFSTRFIVELLSKKQRVVLTGFSFGSLLACAVTASVWETCYNSTDLLRQNLVCITFGQPHVAMPMLDRVTKLCPELVSTIHSFHCEDDPVPRLLRFLDVSWSQEGTVQGKERKIVVTDHLRAPLKDPITSKMVTHIEKLQRLTEQPAEQGQDEAVPLLSELTSMLERVVLKLDPHGSTARQFPPRSTSYLLSTLPTGFMCTQLSQEEAALQSSLMKQKDIRKLTTDVFSVHSVFEYIQTVLFHGYLDKDPTYSLPSAPAHPPGMMVELKPSVRAVDICRHGNETAVVLEGENLWFCHQVTVGGHHELLPAQEATASSIQFNIPHQECDIFNVEDDKVKVSLQSHFSSPIEESISASVKTYVITTRQTELAKLMPSKLIEIAYLCALLEQHPYSKSEPSSHKFKVIMEFLECIVQVVPLESMLYVIANSHDFDTAMSCFQALKSSQHVLPLSELMIEGSHLAAWRMSQTFTALEKVGKKREEVESLLHVTKEDCIGASKYLYTNHDRLCNEKIQNGSADCLCGQDIDKLYPISQDSQQQGSVALRSPLSILTSGRRELCTCLEETQEVRHTSSMDASQHKWSKHNQRMLEMVNNMRKEVKICVNLLGAFMEEQEVNIVLSHSKKDMSNALSIKAIPLVGVGALFGLDYSDVQPILDNCKENELVVKIVDYVKKMSDESPENCQYAAKLQFMVHGMQKNPVTYNRKWISYCYERQLMAVCTDRKIEASIQLHTLIRKWGELFRDNTLSLVREGYRPLIARWLKWALMIHNLREELSKYTAIGVVGLVNSGKSKLVNTLFGIQIPVGTAEASRTTVPFLYNLDKHVEGLDVVDFPGVDDEDDTIPDIADLLVTVAQIVIFVVDYRRVGSQSAKQWLDRLQREKVPVLVCLTFADKFYAEHMSEDGQHPTKETMKCHLEDQFTETCRKIGSSPSRKVQFFSFSQDRDSVLNSPDGRRRLEEVGIGSLREVGAWLVRVFQRDFKQEELASQLEAFIHNHPRQ